MRTVLAIAGLLLVLSQPAIAISEGEFCWTCRVGAEPQDRGRADVMPPAVASLRDLMRDAPKGEWSDEQAKEMLLHLELALEVIEPVVRDFQRKTDARIDSAQVLLVIYSMRAIAIRDPGYGMDATHGVYTALYKPLNRVPKGRAILKNVFDTMGRPGREASIILRCWEHSFRVGNGPPPGTRELKECAGPPFQLP